MNTSDCTNAASTMYAAFATSCRAAQHTAAQRTAWFHFRRACRILRGHIYYTPGLFCYFMHYAFYHIHAPQVLLSCPCPSLPLLMYIMKCAARSTTLHDVKLSMVLLCARISFVELVFFSSWCGKTRNGFYSPRGGRGQKKEMMNKSRPVDMLAQVKSRCGGWVMCSWFRATQNKTKNSDAEEKPKDGFISRPGFEVEKGLTENEATAPSHSKSGTWGHAMPSNH